MLRDFLLPSSNAPILMSFSSTDIMVSSHHHQWVISHHSREKDMDIMEVTTVIIMETTMANIKMVIKDQKLSLAVLMMKMRMRRKW